MSSRIKSFFRRISKDHGGGKPSHSSDIDIPPSAEARKSSAPSILLPVKRGLKEHDAFGAESGTSSKKDDKSGKPVKFKKMSLAFQKDLDPKIPEETMETTPPCTVQCVPVAPADVQTVTSLKSCPPQTIIVPARSGSSTFYDTPLDVPAKTESAVSATITINSVVPQLSSTATPAVDSTKNTVIDSTCHSLVVEPVVPARRNSKNVKEEDKKGPATMKGNDAAIGVSLEAGKSVSITKLENDLSNARNKTSSDSPDGKAASKMQRKVSPSKNYKVAAEVAAPSKTTVSSAKETNSTVALSDSERKTGVELKKVSKKDVNASTEELNAEENAKYNQEKVVRLEKMVSDLVKNAEIKKQEIAALKMQIKRLKVRCTSYSFFIIA